MLNKSSAAQCARLIVVRSKEHDDVALIIVDDCDYYYVFSTGLGFIAG